MFNFFKKNKEAKTTKTTSAAGVVASLGHKLKLTRNSLVAGLTTIFLGKNHLDPKTLNELETKLLTADVGSSVTQQIIEHLKISLKSAKNQDATLALTTIQTQLINILEPCSQPLVILAATKPFVILVVGVNGSGKTTTIGKLAKKLQAEGHRVMLAAGDTFRAAAIDQLKIWGERHQVPVIAQQPGADSAAVIYDALQAATARQYDILIADTAGRLHTHQGLMAELQKVKKTIQKLDSTAPHEVLLVLDATIGQNTLNQVEQFNATLGVTGICLTKLDGTAKGGTIFAIAQATKLPIRFIGVGESGDDLKPFEAKTFVNALFEE